MANRRTEKRETWLRKYERWKVLEALLVTHEQAKKPDYAEITALKKRIRVTKQQLDVMKEDVLND